MYSTLRDKSSNFPLFSSTKQNSDWNQDFVIISRQKVRNQLLRMKDNERPVTQAECSPAKDSYLDVPLKTKMFSVINFQCCQHPSKSRAEYKAQFFLTYFFSQHVCICTICVPNIHGGLEGVRVLGITVISYESPHGAGN